MDWTIGISDGVFIFVISYETTKGMTRIISYNVNGIRAALNKGFIEWLQKEDPDVLCIQETKAQVNQIYSLDYERLGYKQYWYSAIKKGYSGVGILSKMEPLKVYTGMGRHKYDEEGRVLRLDFADFTQVCVYIPSGTTGDVRQDFKMEFLYDFRNYLVELKKTKNKVIVSGDFNICHKPIDINHPEKHKKSSGFLPEEREWFDNIIDDGFVDTFRVFNQEPDQYSWWSYRANSRAKNLGWRIDYHLVSDELQNSLESASILNSVVHSDHCPIKIEIN
jgi:exodeoxyribonuclease-3